MTTLCFVDTETTGLDPDRHEIWEVAVILRGADEPLRADVIRSLTEYRDDPASAAATVPLLISGDRDREYSWQLPVDLGRADPMALDIGHFRERRDPLFDRRVHSVDGMAVPSSNVVVATTGVHRERLSTVAAWCQDFAALTWGAHMIGMVPSFDTDRLWRLLRAHGACPGWHYQPVDVETLAAGYAIGRCRGAAIAGDITRFPGMVQGKAVGDVLPWSSEELSKTVGVDAGSYERHSALGDARWARDVWDAVHAVERTGF